MEKRQRTLLIEPYPYVRELFGGRDDIALYADKAVVAFDGGSQSSYAISHPDADWLASGEVDLDDAKARIRANLPLYYRWMGESDAYEDNQRSFLLFVLGFAETLRRLNVTRAVFFTGVAHHVEYALIETACQLAGVRQVFLYPMPFGKGRLLPVVQDHSIADRQPLGTELSDVHFEQDVLAYRDNFLSRGVPKQNETIGGSAVSRPYAYFKLAEREIKGLIKRLIGRAPPATHLIEKRKGYGLTATLRIINRQKEALDYYLSQAISNEEAERLIAGEAPLPILYAHYQPEASTFPEGGAVVDHLDVVLAMRKAGYGGKILYKEHPGSWIYFSKVTGFSLVGIARSREYYLQLQSLGCVFLQPRYRPGDDLLRKVFPVTITGSVAVERSLTGWRTCCLGEPWFKGAPGVTSVLACFGPDGLFYDAGRWTIDPDAGIKWFSSLLAGRTLTNYPGIGTGRGLDSEESRQEFLGQLQGLVTSFAPVEMVPQ